jgi:hypothetical protein
MVNTPEMISGDSTDEDEVVVHRPRNRRGSSRIVDERISDTSSDDDVQIITNRKVEKPTIFEIEDDEPDDSIGGDDSDSNWDSVIRTVEKSIGPFSSAEPRPLSPSTSIISEVMVRPVIAEPASVKVSSIAPVPVVAVIAAPTSSVPAIARPPAPLPIKAAAKALADERLKVLKIAPKTVKVVQSVAVKAVQSVPVKAVLSHSGNVVASLAAPSISVRARSGSADYTLEKSGRTHDIHSTINSGISSNIRSSLVSSTSSSSSSNNDDRDTIKWKDRLWPSRALNSFCRYDHEIY